MIGSAASADADEILLYLEKTYDDVSPPAWLWTATVIPHLAKLRADPRIDRWMRRLEGDPAADAANPQ